MDKNYVYVFDRKNKEARTNVPRLAIHHSPSGYEWGYQGSGPADLALNILEDVLQRVEYRGPRCECWKGFVFELAWDLHQDLKRELIAQIPHEGGTISPQDLIAWINDKRPNVELKWE